MPDLLASTSLLPLTPGIPPRIPTAATSVAVNFMAMLGEIVLPPSGRERSGMGQALAADGKILPVEEDGDGGDQLDPLLAWLPAGLNPVPVVETKPLPGVSLPGVSLPDDPLVSAPSASQANPIAPARAASAAALPLPEGIVETPAIGLAPTPPAAETAIAATITETFGSGPSVQEAVAIGSSATGADFDALVPVKRPATVPGFEPQAKDDALMRATLTRSADSAALKPSAPAMSVTPPPAAAQAFTAAISAAFDGPAAPAPRATDPAIVQTQTAAAEQLRTIVQPASAADQLPLDLSRDDWTGKMVDRIAILRDAAEVADTRIRLAPENLGNVDVSIRREGDRIHVHFAAENPATRQLLADAAPRLTELADARGVKLGQTSVDAGGGGQQGSPEQPESNQSARPAAAAAAGAESDQDDRVA